ncbi:MAG: SAM-dependent DNA methyltransferase [Planctomycetes bacterium]|nr:SAM-dependent DNA methyltransferase [Planctomycetota bacterium]
MSLKDLREHEVSFCAEVKSWADALFAQHPEWPFARAHIEKYGQGTNTRQDLRVLGREHATPLLSGEVKMPGTPDGRSPYDPVLMQDAYNKADNIQAKYFFTWNVNEFVLFDRSRWNCPMIERRVKAWNLGLALTNSGDCLRPDVQARIRDQFLPQFFAEFARIATGALAEWGMPPDEIFLRSLESHLESPVAGTRDYMAAQWSLNNGFAGRLQEWMTGEMQWTIADPSDPEQRRHALDRAARTLCYVFTNRAIFYKALQAKFDDLKPLTMPARAVDGQSAHAHFRRRFADAVTATGDYEPVFYPDVDDWASSLVFASPEARAGWKGFFVSLAEYDFRRVPSDVLGGIFQRLISPEERQKFGQFFTHQDVVDVINAFCIRRAGDVVLDPACGSGSFLVRAYHRKAWLSGQAAGGRRHQDHETSHQQRLTEIFGCDIALFPAHLATLNLASRQISDEENFPLIRRGNFFEAAESPAEFCTTPGSRGAGATRPSMPVPLAQLDAVVGNPPYVRQELIERRSVLKKGRDETDTAFTSRSKNTKEFFQQIVRELWPGLKLSGRADLHCYFWPMAAKFLKEGGYFGFLTSASWLDVEYGFALQGWVLENFEIIAILESVDEPWFVDARVKTTATILRRCADRAALDANVVRFVRFQKPLADILGERAPGDEAARQFATERLRRRIETSKGFEDDNLRIIAVPQSRLWREGVEAGRLLAKSGVAPDDALEGDDEDDASTETSAHEHAVKEWNGGSKKYAAGKWGRFLRAPDLYFRIMRDHGSRFVRLGEIAEIRFGIKSGCDAFFMPRDVTEEVLESVRQGLPWNNVGLRAPARRAEVESGEVRIVRAGDKTLHPIEAEFLRPEVHSLMQVDRPVVRAADTDRVVLWVSDELKDLAGTYAGRYIRWGAKQTFASKKSRRVPAPQRSTCAARPMWYNLTGGERGVAFWPKAQQYRHIVPGNPTGMICNCNLYDLIPDPGMTGLERSILPAALNSTILALFKTYYGRYAGTEGNLKTEVVDVNLMEVPDVRGVSEDVAGRLLDAFGRMQARPTQSLLEAEIMQCHTTERVRELAQRPINLSDELRQPDRRALDDAVLRMIGVSDPLQRARLLDDLYLETARHYRQIRIVEVQKQVQRTGGKRRVEAEEIAASIWDALEEAEKGPPLAQWLFGLPGARQKVHIPDGKPKALGKGHMFRPGGVDFAQGKTLHQETYAHPEQAALVVSLAKMEIRGPVDLPSDSIACAEWREAIEKRLSDARVRFDLLAASRTGAQALRDAASLLLSHWFTHGRTGFQVGDRNRP